MDAGRKTPDGRGTWPVEAGTGCVIMRKRESLVGTTSMFGGGHEQAGHQPNEQPSGCAEEPRCPGAAPARVRLWRIPPHLAGSPFYDRRSMEKPYVGTHFIEAVTLRAGTASFPKPACRHPEARDRQDQERAV